MNSRNIQKYFNFNLSSMHVQGSSGGGGDESPIFEIYQQKLAALREVLGLEPTANDMFSGIFEKIQIIV